MSDREAVGILGYWFKPLVRNTVMQRSGYVWYRYTERFDNGLARYEQRYIVRKKIW